MISIRSLQKFFNKGKQNEIHVIDDITLDLPERGVVAIFGRSGCGKTTLLNVIGGLDGFESGALTVDGKDIRKNTDETRNRYIGYIFQNYNLQKEQTCYDNVASALYLCGMTDEEEIDKRVMAALLNVGMDKYAKRTPDTLSGGQQQRVAIARAIVKNPRVILADEPTGNLDEANTVMIMDLLKRIAKDHLVLLVTHEEDLVDYYCDKVIELSDGKVVGVRDNHGANGYAARDKNDVYLGELEKRQTQTDEICVEYYGDVAETPVKLRIVQYNGKRYLRVDSPDVQVLDETSEIRLREGKYRATGCDESNLEGFDTSALPPVEGEKFGRLFRFRSALKSGYLDNFK
ncbi:MAG: ABC transporter ATP-binding protein, partial [Clostridia bacterium]|nr:ABC transporter ATP-binding protein [Clostridia bacterium]